MKVLKVLLIMFIAFFLVCCNESKKSFIIDSSNNAILADVDGNIDFWHTIRFQNEAAEKEYTVEFDGVIYHGCYDYSTNRNLSYNRNHYITDELYKFILKDGTNELVSITLMNKDYFENVYFRDDVEDSYNYAVNIAKSIAGRYINIDEYDMSVQESNKLYKEKDGISYACFFYDVTFTKKYANIDTTDYVLIKVSSKGDFLRLTIGELNAFDDINIDFDIDSINEDITNTIKKEFGKLNYSINSLEIESQRIQLTPDKKLCILSAVSVQYGEEDSTGVTLLTYLE